MYVYHGLMYIFLELCADAVWGLLWGLDRHVVILLAIGCFGSQCCYPSSDWLLWVAVLFTHLAIGRFRWKFWTEYIEKELFGLDVPVRTR
jgi:hypothetical protein